jgi:hypothetical protein
MPGDSSINVSQKAGLPKKRVDIRELLFGQGLGSMEGQILAITKVILELPGK